MRHLHAANANPFRRRSAGVCTPPALNAAQRKAVFDLPSAFQKEAEKLRDPIHQIGFWVNAGYFRNRRRCFEPEDFHVRDVAYVATRLGYEPALFDPAAYPARSRQRHCKTIESLSGFRTMDDGHEARLVEVIDRHVAAHDTPKAIFYAAVEKLTAEKIVAPLTIICNRRSSRRFPGSGYGRRD